jgi:hypothetical protein
MSRHEEDDVQAADGEAVALTPASPKPHGWWRRLGRSFRPPKPRLPGSLKIADAPHPITITLGLVSPLLALIALVISLSSYRATRESLELSREQIRFAQRNLQITQRAYLTIKDGKLQVESNTADTQMLRMAGVPSGPLNTASFRAVQLRYDFFIENLGNTPSTHGRFNVTFQLPRGWEIGRVSFDDALLDYDANAPIWDISMRPRSVGPVGPKSAMLVQSAVPFALSEEAARRMTTGVVRRPRGGLGDHGGPRVL